LILKRFSLPAVVATGPGRCAGHARRPVCWAASRGFTLLELLVVMVIIAAIVGLVVPRFGAALPGVELRGAARDVASALRFARGRAIATRGDVAVVFDVNARTYRIEGVPGERERAFGDAITVGLLTGRSELRSESVGAISFFPDGSSTGGRVTLRSGERAFEVDVEWLTGRVSILDE
jgi:general secretion pathway protein H